MHRDVLARCKSHLARGKPTNSPFQSQRNTSRRAKPRIITSFFASFLPGAPSLLSTTELYDVRLDLFALRCHKHDAVLCGLRQDLHPRVLGNLNTHRIKHQRQNLRIGATNHVRDAISKRKNKATFPKLMSASSVPGVTYRRQSNDNLRSVNERLFITESLQM